MGWGQRNARFFMEVDRSSRSRPERILGDVNSGMRATIAGERGALCVELYAVGDEDRFMITFRPWRKSEQLHRTVDLMCGLLNFDKHTTGGISVKLDNDLLEALTLIRAKEIMIKGTNAEKLL